MRGKQPDAKGPPKFSPPPMDWPSPVTISAPISPGRFKRPSETTSGTATISKQSLACTSAASLVKSTTFPKKSGFCTTTQLVSYRQSGRLNLRYPAVLYRLVPGRSRPFQTGFQSPPCNADATAPTKRTALRFTRCAISTASAVAVEPSYMEALATGMPVNSLTCV